MSEDSIQPIITTWALRNFQSIRGTATLDLKPLTIFSGPNSSGKSAVIKSLLMAAQTLSSSAWEVPLVLNGKYTKLGDFEHILHHGSDPPEMDLGFVIKGQEGEVEVKTRIEKDSESSSLVWVKYSIVDWKTESFELNLCSEVELFKRAELFEPTVQYVRTRPIVKEEKESFRYEITKPKNIGSNVHYENAVSASLSHFLPGRALIRVDSSIRRLIEEINQATEAILSIVDIDMPSIYVNWERELSGEFAYFFSTKVYDKNREYKNEYYKKALELLLNHWGNPETIDSLTKSLDQKYKSNDMSEGDIRDLARRMKGQLSDLPNFKKELCEQSSSLKVELETREFPSPYNQIIQQIRRVFERQIFYLGPLRDDPRTIYAIPSQPNQRDVGLKGEYTVAMLDEHKELSVHYPIPPDEEFKGKYSFANGRLVDAVQKWLERMGLAEQFYTEMISKVGYQLSVRPRGVKKDLDLMSLGVGVSQVLPTIVMALLAPKDSVLIFEQPEVHLHPKVQSVLGDFFLGIVGCGKQCIVETHSEHLINRIRRRIAESSDETILQRLGIYFVELKDGVSQFRAVETNEYGAILDWPADFFDEAEKESSTLVRAAMEKRRKTPK